ncbi:MAG: hypothetical protein ACI4XL_13510 [Bacillus sp. (in: firmicutes)]
MKKHTLVIRNHSINEEYRLFKGTKVQCKACKKYMNILPDKTRTTSYNQKRNDILVSFAKHLINLVPESRSCEILGIGRGTYYQIVKQFKWSVFMRL